MNRKNSPLDSLRASIEARMPSLVGDLRALARDHAPEAPRREAGFSITNVDTTAVVRIYDEIWWLGVDAAVLVDELAAITQPQIRVEINSPGGNVFDGIAIYNALRNHPAEVTTRVDGIAASIASIIFQAGDRRVMNPAAQLMIHNAHGVTAGDSRDHAEMAELLDQQDGVLAAIYAAHGSEDAEHYRSLMNAETWLTAERAVAEGLADEIVEPARKTEASTTLVDEITAAVDAATGVISSARRVDALRAEAGKSLSNTCRESLAGLRDVLGQLDGLLTPPADETPRWTEAEIEARLRELDRRLASTR
jgi:ATP-dependent protease ClpP protease subunit